jgi:tetratricopeptide (TPR) repeat protein
MYDPNLFQAFCNIGSCYRSLKQYSESKKFYLKSISINRGDAISHYNLANVLRLMGDF